VLPAVSLFQVSFSYQTKTVLRGIDIEIPRGSYFGVVGPNGSGKTTLAYLIAGIMPPSGGTIDTHGNRVGLILANPENQVVSLVVDEDIAFGPENLGLTSSEISARIDRALKTVRGEYMRQSLTTELSGGELAKVVFAGQLALDADVLVLDEGTVMLDPANRKTLLSTIRELNRDFGKTILHISHRLDDLDGADGIVAIDQGSVAMRSSGVFDLVKRMQDHPIPGIEPGAGILYQAFLKEAGISTTDPEKATLEIAGLLSSGKK
jgi:energy-coupling factor transport system ATP-binding protein